MFGRYQNYFWKRVYSIKTPMGNRAKIKTTVFWYKFFLINLCYVSSKLFPIPFRHLVLKIRKCSMGIMYNTPTIICIWTAKAVMLNNSDVDYHSVLKDNGEPVFFTWLLHNYAFFQNWGFNSIWIKNWAKKNLILT